MTKIDDILVAWREERVQPTYDDLVAVQAEQDRDSHSVPQPQPVQEPEAYAVYWGIGKMRRDSVHLELETAQAVASEIKSSTAIKPLFTSPQAQPLIEVLTELESMYDKADQITPLHKGMRMAISTACDRVNAVMKKHGITKGTT